jgi:alkenylglycerophosphocholine/alkenylglycerophosphoethanolamine hydrolase
MDTRGIGVKWWWLGAYVVVAAANVLSSWFDASPWDTVTKTLLMPLLVGYVWTALRHPFGPGDRLIVVALFFSWLGDLALEPSGDLFFYLGLGMFALAQIAYLLAFNGIQGTRQPWARWIAVPYVIWWLALVIVLAPKMGILVIAVAIYGALLLGMAATSWRVSVASGVGGLFFAVSDSLIALTSLEKVIHVNHSGALIMLTYVFGQLLLVLGWSVLDQPAAKAVASS